MGQTVSAMLARPEPLLDDKPPPCACATQELVVLALIRLAVHRPRRGGQPEVTSCAGTPSSAQEERSWVWGVIGKQRGAEAVRQMPWPTSPRPGHADMHDDHLAWKVRAALRAGNWAQVLPPSRP